MFDEGLSSVETEYHVIQCRFTEVSNHDRVKVEKRKVVSVLN
jgi:4-diphosphocytidyl-2C-methyl-D-erythritol kinase